MTGGDGATCMRIIICASSDDNGAEPARILRPGRIYPAINDVGRSRFQAVVARI